MAASNLTLWKKANAPKTEKRYTEAALEFLRWCDENFESPVTYEELDDTFAEYVEFAYETGVSLSRAEYALHGLCNVIPRAIDWPHPLRCGPSTVLRLLLAGW
jgi:hypothetical protein